MTQGNEQMGRKSRSKKLRAAEFLAPKLGEPTASTGNEASHSLWEPASTMKKKWLLAGALIAAVFLTYQPVWLDEFIWDDDRYVTGNQTLHDLKGLERIWSDRQANPQYYPLV